jgi:hypothetical protein
LANARSAAASESAGLLAAWACAQLSNGNVRKSHRTVVAHRLLA